MSENFRKIKKKYMTVAIVAGCILGACLGVALTCALAVIFKTCGVNCHWAIYIPVALVLSAGAGYLFFLILRPDDKRIAKKLDRDFSLNQKVQTMVEFANVEGDLPALQRVQTDEALGAVAKKRVDLKWLLKFAFIPVIAAAMLFAGIFVPAKKSGYVDPAYDMPPVHKAALENLIADVKGSSLETEIKTYTVIELEVLLDMLQDAEYESTMKGAVINAVHKIDGFVADANSYLKIYNVMKDNEELTSFSRAVINGVVDYKNGVTLTKMDAVKAKERTVDDDIAAVLTRWETKYLESYSQDGTPLDSADSAIKLLGFADAIDTVLSDEGDENIKALKTAVSDGFYNSLTELAEILANHAEAVLNGEASFNAEGYLNNFIDNAKVALGKQSYNCMMDEYIRNRLSSIFGISRSEMGSNLHIAPNPTQESEGGEKDPQGSEGSYGDGVHKYGSNEEILDVDTGEKKKYGDPVNPDNENYTYYNKYYDRAMEYIQSGDCPPEVAAYIRQYFAYLNNGMDKTNN